MASGARRTTLYGFRETMSTRKVDFSLGELRKSSLEIRFASGSDAGPGVVPGERWAQVKA